MFDEHDRIFLLFSWWVNVHEEERDIMTTYKAHEACVIKSFHQSLLLLAIHSFIWWFTLVDSLILNLHVMLFHQMLMCPGNLVPNNINLRLGKNVDRFIEGCAVTSRAAVAMMEVTVNGNMNVSAVRVQVSKHIPAKTCRTVLHKLWSTHSQTARILSIVYHIGNRGKQRLGACSSYVGMTIAYYMLNTVFYLDLKDIKPLNSLWETALKGVLYLCLLGNMNLLNSWDTSWWLTCCLLWLVLLRR